MGSPSESFGAKIRTDHWHRSVRETQDQSHRGVEEIHPTIIWLMEARNLVKLSG
jgi:hypothetical protein